MTLEQILWRFFVVYHCATFVFFAALDAWAAWGVTVLFGAAYMMVRLRWIEP